MARNATGVVEDPTLIRQRTTTPVARRHQAARSRGGYRQGLLSKCDPRRPAADGAGRSVFDAAADRHRAGG
jgi:hypothetical protein